jgi:hypothetical protein
MLNTDSTTAKSLVNRLESALGKEGSASTRLSMAGSSVLVLADKMGDDDEASGLVYFLGSFLKLASEIAKDNKQEKPAKAKAKRETWHDADSEEAQEILSKKSPAKPARGKSVPAKSPDLSSVIAQALAKALGEAGL